MTEEQARQIEVSDPQWIAFYYGRVDYGYVTTDRFSNNIQWYFINKWREYKKSEFSKDWLTKEGNAEPIHLEMIELADGQLPKMKDYESTISPDDYDETILIVLGAGASYDFTDNLENGLPLTKDIFDNKFKDLRELYPGAMQQYNSLVDIEDLESYFQRKWKLLARSYNPILMRNLLSVQYYMQQLFLRLSIYRSRLSPNFYNALVQQMHDYCNLRHGRVKFLVVSFNYDTLFEQELTKEMGYTFNEIDEYDEPSRKILLFKLHGSSNWCRYQNNSTYGSASPTFSKISNQLLDQLNDTTKFYLSLSCEIKVMHTETKAFNDERIDMRYDESINQNINPFLNHIERDAQIRSNKNFFPHMLIPYKEKDEFLLPISQVARLERMLEKSTRAYCIGWKGNEKKFIDMLVNKDLHISWITGPNGQKEILEGEAKRLTKAKHAYYTQGFAHCMKYVNTTMENMFDGKRGIGVNHG
jgi:hypothetical protein